MSRGTISFLMLVLPVMAALADAAAAGDATDKSQFNLFNPTPDALMREMSTDRPDRTESAYTVDAGHFQVEMDLFNYAYTKDEFGPFDVRIESYAIAPFNLKVGLLNNVDLQLVFAPYLHQRIETRNAVFGSTQVDTESGFSDLVTRVKINLWGNDGGKTALAVMPFLTFPTHQHDLGSDEVQGGVIVPLAVELPAGWYMGVMTEVDFLSDNFSDGHHAEFVNSITFGHAIYKKLSGYVEFYSRVSAEEGVDWMGTVDGGLTYALTDNIQLDGGINVGVTDTAADVNPFVGLSVRF